MNTNIDYKTSCRTDIDDYFTYDFSLAATIIVLLLWSIILFLLFSMCGIKNLYMVATILLDREVEKIDAYNDRVEIWLQEEETEND